MRRFLRENSLSLVFLSSSYLSAVMENWQSEYLQFTLFILLTVWLLQKGSPESKPLDDAGRESDERQQVGKHSNEHSPSWARVQGLRRALYENSLAIAMGTIWIGTWLAQSLTGTSEYNAERPSHQEAPVSWLHYLGSATGVEG